MNRFIINGGFDVLLQESPDLCRLNRFTIRFNFNRVFGRRLPRPHLHGN